MTSLTGTTHGCLARHLDRALRTGLLGIRHGFDADHLATIDGLTRLNAQRNPRLALAIGLAAIGRLFFPSMDAWMASRELFLGLVVVLSVSAAFVVGLATARSA